MKQLLLLGAALALVGCNSTPSEGDIEDFLESRFAPCQNIKVVDITKSPTAHREAETAKAHRG